MPQTRPVESFHCESTWPFRMVTCVHTPLPDLVMFWGRLSAVALPCFKRGGVQLRWAPEAGWSIRAFDLTAGMAL
eukprot:1366423-Alexandrium_andersonii.AAC.1